MAVQTDSPTLGRGSDWNSFYATEPLEGNTPLSPSTFGLLLFSQPDAESALGLLGGQPDLGYPSQPGLAFSDISGTITVDQLPPGSLATVDDIGQDALYFFEEATGLPMLVNPDQVAVFLSGHIGFSDLSGVIDQSQFPSGSVASLDSIDEDAFYFFDNVLFTPKLLGHDDTIAFLLPDQTGNDGNFLQTNAGVLSWAASSGGGAWGSITGTLGDQTDLQSALDAKADDSAVVHKTGAETVAGKKTFTDPVIVGANAEATNGSVGAGFALLAFSNEALDGGLDHQEIDIGSFPDDTFADGTYIEIKTYSRDRGNAQVNCFYQQALGGNARSASMFAGKNQAGMGIVGDSTQTLPLFSLLAGTNVLTVDKDANLTTTGNVTAAAFIGDGSGLTGLSGGGDASTNTSSSVDSEVALFSGTGGKTLKRATGTGLAKLTSGILSTTTDNSSNWDAAYTDRLKWDGGATGLTAATGRTSLGLAIGTNIQAWDADLDALASLVGTHTIYHRSAANTWIPIIIGPGLDFTGATLSATLATETIWDAKGDLVGGTGADTATKLTVGANDTILMADSAQTTGLKWGTPTTVKTALGLGTASTLASDTDGTLATNSDSRIATQKAVKTYIDGINAALLAAIAALDSKDEVAYCATSALPTCNYANGTLGVGATLTATTNGPLIVDGVTTVLGAQGFGVLVAGQASDFQNGWYTLTQQGVVAVSPWILTRRTPDDQAAEIGPGYLTAVEAPTGLTAGSNNQRVFLSIAPTPFVIGTDSLTFAMVGGTYTAGNGLSLSGTAFSINTAITADLNTAQSLTNKKLGSLTSNGFVKTGSGDGTLSVDTASYQPLDSDLTTLAGLTATTDNFIVSVSSAWASRTPSQVRTTLGLVIGTNVQAWDADLDAIAALSPANNAVMMGNGSNWVADVSPTFSDVVTFAACNTAAPSFSIPAGTLETTPSDGDVEADGNCFYGCTDTGNRGYIPIVHIIRADSTVTQANDANAHAIFTTPTNGRLTLETGTYRFRGVLQWTSMSATSGNLKIDILGAGGASTGGWLWFCNGFDAIPTTAAAFSGNFATTSASGVNCLGGSTATTASVLIEGTFEVTGGGTIIPTQTMHDAGAAVLTIGSFIEFWRIGSTSMTSVGQWD